MGEGIKSTLNKVQKVVGQKNKGIEVLEEQIHLIGQKVEVSNPVKDIENISITKIRVDTVKKVAIVLRDSNINVVVRNQEHGNMLVFVDSQNYIFDFKDV